MKKILMHGAYILAILFFLILAQIKAAEAEKQTILALAYQAKAEMSAEEARKSAAQARMAQDQAQNAMKEAEVQRALAEEQLAKCKGK